MNLNVNKVYLCHHPPLVERLQFQKDQFKKHNIKFELVAQEIFLPGVADGKLTIPEISLLCKHKLIYYDIVENEYLLSLIVEDDVLLIENFVKHMNEWIENLPQDTDMLFVGSAGGQTVKENQSNKLILSDESKTTDCYLISFNCAKKLIECKEGWVRPIDHELTFKIRELKLKVFHLEKGLVTQGSQVGRFKSAIR